MRMALFLALTCMAVVLVFVVFSADNAGHAQSNSPCYVIVETTLKDRVDDRIRVIAV